MCVPPPCATGANQPVSCLALLALLLVLVVAGQRNVVAVVAVELILHDLQDTPGARSAERDEGQIDAADDQVALRTEHIDRRGDEADQDGQQQDGGDERVLLVQVIGEKLPNLEPGQPKADNQREAEDDGREAECNLHHD